MIEMRRAQRSFGDGLIAEQLLDRAHGKPAQAIEARIEQEQRFVMALPPVAESEEEWLKLASDAIATSAVQQFSSSAVPQFLAKSLKLLNVR